MTEQTLRTQMARLTPLISLPTSGVTAQLAWITAVTAVVVSLISVVTSIGYAIATGDAGNLLSHVVLNPFITVTYVVLGALMAAQHSRNAIGWIFLVVGALTALNLGAMALDRVFELASADAPWPAAFAQWLDNWFWMPGVALTLVMVPLLFPDGRLFGPRWRFALWSATLGMAAAVLALALHPGPIESWGTGPNPFGIPAAAPMLEVLLNLSAVLLVIGVVGAVASFVVRYQAARGAERAQMKWMFFAALGMALGVGISAAVWFAFPNQTWVIEFSIFLSSLTQLGLAVAAAIAILRYRLYDIDLLINRTLVYGAPSVAVLALYALVVSGIGLLFHTGNDVILPLLATALAAVLFQPLRERLQRGVNRLLYGERDEPFEVLARLGKRLEGTLSLEMVYPTIVETVSQALKLPYVALTVRHEGSWHAVESHGRAVAEPAVYPLRYQGETVGQLLVAPRAPDEVLGPADERILRTIARQAGSAVHAAQLMLDLKRSRQQLVTAREEERRRLRRDLHDGLGASLAALNLEAGVLRRAIRSDPDRAEALADEFRADIRTTIDQIRHLVYELRPPTLDQLGLVGAVRILANQCGVSDRDGVAPLHVEVDAPEEMPPLPAALEVAAYRIVQEALTNVVHHAHARHCRVDLDLSDVLSVAIVDDGVGMAATTETARGVGLLSMRERALELGGACNIEAAPDGGTRVSARLPLPEE